MTNWIGTARVTICIALAAASLGGVLASPARADDHGRDAWREDGHDHGRDAWREDGHDRGREYGRSRWREHDRYDDYRHRPDVYYSAPPVVVAPREYYVQPGATLNFSLPFFR